MFDVIAFLVQEYQDYSLCPPPEALARRLFAMGFEDEEIEDALNWLAALDADAEQFSDTSLPTSPRHFHHAECAHLSLETRGFLWFLDANQVLTVGQRECVIERLLVLPSDEVSPDAVKLVVLTVLWHQCVVPDILIADELQTVLGWDTPLQ
mgnify:FL=1|jgi:Smg protein